MKLNDKNNSTLVLSGDVVAYSGSNLVLTVYFKDRVELAFFFDQKDVLNATIAALDDNFVYKTIGDRNI